MFLNPRAAGVDIGRQAPGWLVAWQYSSTGDLFAEVQDVELASHNRRGRRMVAVLAPAAAVQPRDPNSEQPPS